MHPGNPAQTSSTLDLALAALQSLAAVAFVVAAGWIYALKGNFPLTLQRGVAQMVVQLLAPCLLLVSISHTVNAEEFYLWWPIPALFCLLTGLAYFGAVILCALLGIPPSRARFIASAAMMNNTNSLPVALMHSLCRDSGSRRVMDPMRDAAHVARRGIAFILFYSLFSNILRWTVCYRLMAPSREDELPSIQFEGGDDHGVVDVHDQAASGLSVKEEELFPGDALVADVPCADRTTYAGQCRRRSLIFEGSEDGLTIPDHESSPKLSMPTERTPLILPDRTPTASPVLGPMMDLPPPIESVVVPRGQRLRRMRDTVLEVMNAPLYAAILALFIGLVPPIKALFFSTDGMHSAPLEEIVTDPLYSLGEASVPIIILTLGGQLGSMKKSREGAAVPPSEPLDIGLVIFLRMILIPTFTLPALRAAAEYVPLARDHTFVMAMVLLAACPPALNLLNMAQAQRNHENITARLMFWSYLISVPLLTGWVVLDLMLLEGHWPSRAA